MHHQETEQWKYFRSLIAPIAVNSGKVEGAYLVTIFIVTFVFVKYESSECWVLSLARITTGCCQD